MINLVSGAASPCGSQSLSSFFRNMYIHRYGTSVHGSTIFYISLTTLRSIKSSAKRDQTSSFLHWDNTRAIFGVILGLFWDSGK